MVDQHQVILSFIHGCSWWVVGRRWLGPARSCFLCGGGLVFKVRAEATKVRPGCPVPLLLLKKATMLFNKRKREEKKRLQEEERKHLEKSKSYAAELTQAQEALAHKNPLLQKGLQLAESAEAKGLLAGFKAGLAKTRRFFSSGIFALQGEGAVTEQFLEELEEGLLAADLGVVTAVKVMDHLRDQVNRGAIANRDQLLTQMRQVIGRLVTKEDHRLPVAQSGPTVYLFVGVNGAGKTTSIAKLASQFQAEGKKVLAAAGDTFRAAAVEQLEVWCKRAQIDMVKKELNSDP